jgi:hypothetical protein
VRLRFASSSSVGGDGQALAEIVRGDALGGAADILHRSQCCARQHPATQHREQQHHGDAPQQGLHQPSEHGGDLLHAVGNANLGCAGAVEQQASRATAHELFTAAHDAPDRIGQHGECVGLQICRAPQELPVGGGNLQEVAARVEQNVLVDGAPDRRFAPRQSVGGQWSDEGAQGALQELRAQALAFHVARRMLMEPPQMRAFPLQQQVD